MAKTAHAAKGKAKDKTSAAREAESLSLPAATASMSAFEAAFPAAKALAKNAIRPFKTSIDLVSHNVGVALGVVSPFLARVPAELPRIDVAKVEALPSIVSAIAYAISLDVTPSANVAALVADAAKMRRILLPIARSAAEAGQIAESAVTAIEEGKGSLDLAQDCLDLASLLVRSQSKLRKGQVDPADVKKAESAGQKLKDALNPKGGKRPKKRAKVDGVFVDEARDRLWTLFLQNFDILWRVGSYFLGRAVEEALPLPTSMTHLRKKKRSKQPTPPTPPKGANPPAT